MKDNEGRLHKESWDAPSVRGAAHIRWLPRPAAVARVGRIASTASIVQARLGC